MREIYIDESSAKHYLIAAALVNQADKTALRKALSQLRMPGQNRLHFVDESDQRRRKILSTLTQLNTRTVLVISENKNHKEARSRCLTAVMKRASELEVKQVVLEMDDSTFDFDERVLYQAKRQYFRFQNINYTHERSRSEPLLWIPDAVAWCFAKGGDWKRRVDPLIDEIIRLD